MAGAGQPGVTTAISSMNCSVEPNSPASRIAPETRRRRNGCHEGFGDMRGTYKRNLTGLLVGAAFHAVSWTGAQAGTPVEGLRDLVRALEQVSATWALNAPSGAEIMIRQDSGLFTMHSGENTTAEDRRWAAQVRSGMILAQQAGAIFEASVITQASLGLWSIRLENGLEVVAAEPSQALAYFLSAILEQPQTADLDEVIIFLENTVIPATRLAPGGSEIFSVPNEAVNGVSASGDVGITLGKTDGIARIDVAPNAKSGYYTLYLFGGDSRFAPIATQQIKVDAAQNEF